MRYDDHLIKKAKNATPQNPRNVLTIWALTALPKPGELYVCEWGGGKGGNRTKSESF